MQKLIEGAKLIRKEMESNAILGMKFDRGFNADTSSHYTKVNVHVTNDDFKEVVEDLNIQPCYVEKTEKEDDLYPIELELNVDGIYFFTIMDEHEYEAEFREWHTEEPNIDEEFLVTDSHLPENIRLMKAAGHSFRDFE